jgi:hypothetical protein
VEEEEEEEQQQQQQQGQQQQASTVTMYPNVLQVQHFRFHCERIPTPLLARKEVHGTGRSRTVRRG